MGASIRFFVPGAPWDLQPQLDWESYPTELYIPRIAFRDMPEIQALPRQKPPNSMFGKFIRTADGKDLYGEMKELPAGDALDVFCVRAADLMTLADRDFVVGEDCLSKRAAWAYFSVCPPETRILVWIGW